MRILHLPTAIGGNAWGLAQGERERGAESHVLVAGDSFIGYPADIKLGIEKESNKFLRYWKKWRAFCKIRNAYDIFHFNCGTTLLHSEIFPWLYLFDLHLYPKKAKLFVTYNGTDARQKLPPERLSREPVFHYASDYALGYNTEKKDALRRMLIKKMSGFVQHIWALNPDLLYFLPPNKASFLPYTVSRFDVEPALPNFDRKIKILHAPTNRATKGSQYILKAFENLKKKYPNAFEVVLVENVPHAQAVQMYRSADLIVDQVLIGWYGAFAVEAMLMGKPVIARIAQEDLHFIPPKMREELQQSIIHADAFSIESVLERCLLDRTLLRNCASNGMEYARRWHNPRYVASLTQEKYQL